MTNAHRSGQISKIWLDCLAGVTTTLSVLSSQWTFLFAVNVLVHSFIAGTWIKTPKSSFLFLCLSSCSFPVVSSFDGCCLWMVYFDVIQHFEMLLFPADSMLNPDPLVYCYIHFVMLHNNDLNFVAGWCIFQITSGLSEPAKALLHLN